MFISPLGTAQAPPVFPIQGPMGYLSMPPRFGLVSPGGTGTGVTGTGPSTSTGVQMGSPASSNAGKGKMGKDNTEQAGTDKGKSWMNFAHWQMRRPDCFKFQFSFIQFVFIAYKNIFST